MANTVNAGDKVLFSAPLSNGGVASWAARVVKVEDGVAYVWHPLKARSFPFSPVSKPGLYKYAADSLANAVLTAAPVVVRKGGF